MVYGVRVNGVVPAYQGSSEIDWVGSGLGQPMMNLFKIVI